MNNHTALQFSRNYYRKPRGGYPAPKPGSINRSGPRVIIRFKNGITRPALNQPKPN